jgi:Domain of unknown function (DUF4160)
MRAHHPMPTILKIKGYRFFFFSLEGREPAHIHVEHGDRVAKFWLNPVNLASSYGFKSYELTEIRAMVAEHRESFLEKWHDFFSNKI